MLCKMIYLQFHLSNSLADDADKDKSQDWNYNYGFLQNLTLYRAEVYYRKIQWNLGDKNVFFSYKSFCSKLNVFLLLEYKC